MPMESGNLEQLNTNLLMLDEIADQRCRTVVNRDPATEHGLFCLEPVYSARQHNA